MKDYSRRTSLDLLLQRTFKTFRGIPFLLNVSPARLFFYTSCAITLLPSISSAEIHYELYPPSESCPTALSSFAKLSSENLSDNSSKDSAGLYLDLLEHTLSEIQRTNALDSNVDRSALQIRILQSIVESQTPVDPLTEVSRDPSIHSIINQNHFLRFLASGKAFQKVMTRLKDNEWITLKEYAFKKMTSMNAQLQNQADLKIFSKEDFVEVANEFRRRNRLHDLIERKDFAGAIVLLQNPLATTRYINMRDRSNLTPRDIFERVSPQPRDVIAMDLESALANKNALTGTQLLDLEIELTNSLSEGSGNLIEFAYSRGADLNFKHPFSNQSILFRAIHLSKVEFIRELLRFDVDLNTMDSNQFTPIQVAIGARNSEIVKLLGQAGADLSGPHRGFNLAELAIEFKDWKTLRVLAELGVDLNSNRGRRNPPIFYLLNPDDPNKEKIDYSEALQIFKDFQIDLNQTCSMWGDTLAHVALSGKSANFLQSLADFGMNIDKQTKEGKHPLDIVFPSGDPIYQKILKIYYNYYSAKGNLPASREITRFERVPGAFVYKLRSMHTNSDQ